MFGKGTTNMLNVSNLQMVSINGETILPITLYGTNRSLRVTEWHRRVMVDYLGIPINYVEAPFHLGASHGQVMNEITRLTINAGAARPTYYLWLDNDAFFMRKGVLEMIYNIVYNKITLFGHAWNAQHKTKPRGGNHPYASQATLCYSSSLYNACGRPNLDHHNPRSDTAEELTFEVEERGYILSLIYPSAFVRGGSPISQTAEYGMGNIYGPNLMYHCSRADLPSHEDTFIEMAKRVVSGEFELINQF